MGSEIELNGARYVKRMTVVVVREKRMGGRDNNSRIEPLSRLNEACSRVQKYLTS